MESGDRLISAIQAARRVFDHQNAALPEDQRDEKWQQYWNDIGTTVNTANMASSLPTSLVPQKRSSCTAQLGSEPGPKRIPASLEVSAPYLERHISAPAGTNPARNTMNEVSSRTRPINIPGQHKRHNSRRLSTSCASFTRPPFYANSLGQINEVHSYSPDDFLAQSPDNNVATLAFSFGESLEFERGELHTTHMSHLTVPDPPSDGSNSPNSTDTINSHSSTTSGSTAYIEPMTRAGTNKQNHESFSMFGVDSGVNHVRTESAPNMLNAGSNNFLSRHFRFFPSVPMKPSLSQQSESSSDDSSSTTSSSSSCGATSVVVQDFPVRVRPLAPKQQNDASDPQPRIVAVQAEDGTIKQKAEIPRTTRQQPQRKTTFCEYCNDQPSGFHGDHELRRHIERHHTQIRKVWICRDASEDGTFLASCKACKNKKTYGANYNAAAHLRRAHFNPCKNKRGGRGKKSEGRGGMGGGSHPPMEELKAWMFESYEINLNGKIFIQELPPDTNIADIDLENLSSFAQVSSTAVEPDFDLELDPGVLPMNQKHASAPNYNSFAPLADYHAPMTFDQAHAMSLNQHHVPHYMPIQHQPHPHHMMIPVQPQHGYPYYHH